MDYGMLINSRGSEWNLWDLHVHTASSYDYQYKESDADEQLCQTLLNNNVKAVAITDHFTIDKDRIENLRSIAPEIVFFPGVELRTDKGSDNLHIILIFSEKTNVDILSSDFDAIMRRQKAKAANSNETIHWEFSDIVEFAQNHDALITVHAGRKTNGIDKISNALPVKQAIKHDIADAIHFFEIGQKRDIADYEQIVFKSVKPKPLIICSDNHNPIEYMVKEKLWIKADLTFAGLKQCLYQPGERVFIGNVPPVLDRVAKNKQNNIASISCSRVDKPANKDSEWFSFDIPLNPGMVAVIGNKGSGKSAFSDILGHLCNCNTMGSASFLNNRRFRKSPKNYANDYFATLTWLDDESRSKHLAVDIDESFIEDAQYLPQKYIEDVCNDFEDTFQNEIDKVIFSYVEKAERGDAQNLDGLVRLKSRPLELGFQDERIRLEDINSRIIELERKKTKEYRKTVVDHLAKAKDTLNRHEKSKPTDVVKPAKKESDIKYQTKLSQINQNIQEIKIEIENSTDRISAANAFINDIQALLAKMTLLQTQFDEVQDHIEAIVSKYDLESIDCVTELIIPTVYLESLINDAEDEIKRLKDSINSTTDGLSLKLKKLETDKEALISSADADEKAYQKYLADLNEWNEKRNEIVGEKDKEGSIAFFEHELNYLDTQIDSEYNVLVADRDGVTKRIYNGITKLSKIYQGIYAPIQGEISQLLGSIEDGVSFHAEVFMKDANLPQKILSHINQKYNGKYGRSHNSIQEIEECVKITDFEDEDSVMDFVHNMSDVITSDFETADKRVAKQQEFYDLIFGLEYIGVDFKLKLADRSLDELSPGERGIVLLIFYLALSKEKVPIIIDQPEDNLDNQSVYSKLVPCICKAKQQRQVIIVTHNPNIAVACDAEQIIYCDKEKNANHISYESGSIENPAIRDRVVDVLEGTMPAFDLRRLKYK